MKKLRWPLLIVLVALAVIGVLLITHKPASLNPAPPAPTPIVEVPVQGGVYIEALIGSLSRLNPLLDGRNAVDRDIDRLIFSSLVRFDERGIPHGDLAASWGISKDGLIYNFEIRANATWHDGKPVTSDDVIFTLELMRGENSPLRPDLLEFWNQVEVVRLDERVVQFRLSEPFAPFMDYLTFGILPEHLVGDLSLEALADSAFNLQPVGSGPYRFDRLILENGKIAGVALKADPNYYLGQAFIDQIAFRYYPTSRAAWAAFESGEVMGVGQITSDTLQPALRNETVNTYSLRLPALSLVIFNLDDTQLPFFQDADVRRALMLGLNRQWVIDNLLDGQGILANGPIFPGNWAYYDAGASWVYDPTAATALLKKAGYVLTAESEDVLVKDNIRLEFELLYQDDAFHADLAQAIQEDWARLGVGVILKAVSYDQMVSESLEPRKYQAALIDLNLARSADPDPYPFWHQSQATGGQNYSKWNDRQASEFLEQARMTVDMDERTRLYRNFQVRFAKEIPAITLYYPVYTYAVSSEVQGITLGPLMDPSDRFNNITTWYLKTKAGTKSTPTASPVP